MADLFDGFDLRMIETEEATLRVRIGGSGPGLLLLHGHPQTHLMWHRIAPTLARHFTVVAPDLRGYGDSTAPPTAADHEQASKRAMARDGVRLMEGLGFDRFAVVGHDRGGRVAYRMVLDHPERVARLAVLDIIPTGEVLGRLTVDVARAYAGWFFLGQPAPVPETVVGQNPTAYYFGGREGLFHPDALADYVRYVSRPETIHTMCEDQRAAFGIDRHWTTPTGADEGSPAPSSRSGRPVTTWGGCSTSCRSGGTGPTTSPAGRSPPATSWPRRTRRPSLPP